LWLLIFEFRIILKTSIQLPLQCFSSSCWAIFFYWYQSLRFTLWKINFLIVIFDFLIKFLNILNPNLLMFLRILTETIMHVARCVWEYFISLWIWCLRNDSYTHFSQQPHNKLTWLIIFYYFFTKRKENKTKK
jgi:hypothetical protein